MASPQPLARTGAPRFTLLREQMLIGGQWVGADSGEAISVTNPATGEVIGTVPRGGTDETRRAIEAADKAFAGWRATPAGDRAAKLHKLADLILANAEELAVILTTEQGKPLPEARGEIGASAAYVRWFAEEARRLYGDVIPSPWAGRRILVTKEPVGVCAAITPWNFPSSMLSRKIGAALAAGCTVVCKPAELTPFSGLAWGVLAEMAGIPAGVVNIVTGKSSLIGAEMTSNPIVKKVTFTGSTPVGKLLVKQSADTMKKVSMELGGNAPFLVFDDADLDLAVEQAIASKFRNVGQTCVCANRFYVQAGIYDAFAAKFAEASKKLKVGNGMEEGVAAGPLIDEKALKKVESLLADALGKGAQVLAGGKQPAQGGTFFEPTVLKGATQDMDFAREEIFGPLAPLFKFETEEEAVRYANDTEYGLACYFFTKDLGRAFRVSEALQYGQVGVNAGVITTEVAPFGGVKESGVGREGSKYGCDDYLNIKYVCLGGL
ncbi:NAD-dependent succinate-semialdehyde dehydrogenase [Xanthobacter tagetidis]|jgi:succinate-semialdehyde dehydrogenase/glutarate-semialdehyde dehydrogenase|uniref:NAD-dependent succinate-semialdehyde dehydrogenase n=1 Tax=Xanthobacter tagetidis TaxID=60216 RepID=A0A3L7APJ5_9HYPH|nr:NAD-dependent succinate-semialdehyde dehydrogenase [Xanthobacter tagetidis]MBB6307859.1 succinate-semialdehyde dehydrogenase/glutarate-semialdehyde dehydrogenase [Xanthobacter tagetidis]RLP81520.1 NAD-dependent succinate-semialdehyde dehydrogenase [Xanthobacter tagetidis]